MAKNEVTLTFAGDSQALERTFDKVGSGAKGLETDLDRLSRRTKDTDDEFRRTRAGVEKYGSGLDGLGNRADELDTRFMGLSDGIQGTTDLMKAGTLAPHELAMAFADLGSAAYNTVVPSLQGVRTKVGELVADFRSGGPEAARMRSKLMGFAAMGAGIAGIVAVATAIDQMNKAASEAKIEQLTTQFMATGDAMETLASIGNEGFWHPFRSGADELIGTFETLLQQSPQMAESFVDQMEAERGVSDTTREMREQIDIARGANEGMAESLEVATLAERDLLSQTEELTSGLQWLDTATQAVIDGFLSGEAAADATNAVYGRLEERIAALAEDNEAFSLALHDNSAAASENREIMRSLTDSIAGQIEAAAEQGATTQELNAIRAGEIDRLRELAGRYGLTESDVQRYIDTLNAIPVSKSTTINAHDWASGVVEGVLSNLNRVPQFVTTTLRVQRQGHTTSGLQLAGGGIVPQYFASGGIGGPRGTDTVPAWLTPGEMVLSANQQAQLFDMANGRGGGHGGPTVIVHVAGSVLSDRDLARKLQEMADRGAFR